MESFADRMNLLIDMREIVLLDNAIKNIDVSIDMLQNEIDKHPASKYKNYRPKTSSERQKMWETNEDLGKIVGPQHKIMTFKKYLEKKQDELKEALKNKTGKSFEELMDTLYESEKALVNDPSNNQIGETYSLQSNEEKHEIKGFNLDEYFKEQEQGKMAK